jgi:hypothetical protein
MGWQNIDFSIERVNKAGVNPALANALEGRLHNDSIDLWVMTSKTGSLSSTASANVHNATGKSATTKPWL